MALDTFIAGRYSGTYNSVDVGITRDGYEITLDAEYEDLGETDAWGLSVIDSVWRGGNCFVQFTSTAYKAGVITPFWPFGMALGGLANAANPIGRLASDMALAFVLTSTAATPAVATPATLTVTKALLAKNSNGRLMFNSKLREVPIRLRCYPNTASGNTSFFTLT